MEVPRSRPDLDRQLVCDGYSYEQAMCTVGVLESVETAELVSSGHLTLAMIRPQLEQSTVLEAEEDTEIAKIIEQHIDDLEPWFKFSIIFDEAAVGEFYEGRPKDSQLLKPPHRDRSVANRWAEFSNIMTSGPTTVLLLIDTEGSAVSKWRSQIGHRDIEGKRDFTTIRGKFGLDNYNNLVHGSDNPESIFRELRIISELIKRGAIDRLDRGHKLLNGSGTSPMANLMRATLVTNPAN